MACNFSTTILDPVSPTTASGRKLATITGRGPPRVINDDLSRSYSRAHATVYRIVVPRTLFPSHVCPRRLAINNRESLECIFFSFFFSSRAENPRLMRTSCRANSAWQTHPFSNNSPLVAARFISIRWKSTLRWIVNGGMGGRSFHRCLVTLTLIYCWEIFMKLSITVWIISINTLKVEYSE